MRLGKSRFAVKANAQNKAVPKSQNTNLVIKKTVLLKVATRLFPVRWEIAVT